MPGDCEVQEARFGGGLEVFSTLLAKIRAISIRSEGTNGPLDFYTPGTSGRVGSSKPGIFSNRRLDRLKSGSLLGNFAQMRGKRGLHIALEERVANRNNFAIRFVFKIYFPTIVSWLI